MMIPTQQGHLEALVQGHAQPLFELIEGSRTHLGAWLPWIADVESLADAEQYIALVNARSGPQFVIQVTQQSCGGIGFYRMDAAGGTASIGYWLGRTFVGRGIVSDALLSLCEYGFASLGLRKIEIHCGTANIKSRQVAQRLGFYQERINYGAERVQDRNIDHAVYSVLPPELESTAALIRAAGNGSFYNEGSGRCPRLQLDSL